MVAAAGIAAAGISAAGSVGAAAISRGGGGGGFGSIPTIKINTPAFNFTGEKDTSTGGLEFLTVRKGSPGLYALQDRFPRIMGDIDTLRESLRPGFGALTKARLGAIRDSRAATLGTLRNSLGRRRLSGSNFEANTLIQAEREFGRAEEQARAESTLQEADAVSKILQQEFAFIETELQRDIAESALAANVGTALTSVLLGNANAAADRASEDAAGAGQVAGSLLGQLGGGLLAGSGGGGGGSMLFWPGSAGGSEAINWNTPRYTTPSSLGTGLYG